MERDLFVAPLKESQSTIKMEKGYYLLRDLWIDAN